MRSKPYPPIFNKSAASTTETGVGASTWASGNQVCKGTIGSLIAKPKNRNRKAQYLAEMELINQGLLGSKIELEIKFFASIMCSMLKVCTSFPDVEGSWTEMYNPISTTRIRIDPKRV